MKDEKIVILHILDSLDYGGIQSFLLNIYKNIDRDKIRFDFLLTYRGVHDKEFADLGSKIYYIPNIKDVGYLKYTKGLKSFFRAHRDYQNVHIHYSQLTGLVAMIAHREGIQNIISHSHSATMQSKGKTALVKKIFQIGVFRYPNHYLACSDKAAKFLFCNKAKKVKIIHNGVDLEEYRFNIQERSRIRNELGFSKNDVVIGHVGRMDRVKNQAFLIKVFREICNKRDNVRLLLIGDGPEKKNLEQIAKELELGNKVMFLGNKNDSNRYYNAMDCFVFPSISEGLGISLIEAQANGLCCFASTAVPKDADATKTTSFVSLDESAEHWADKILNADLKRYDKTNMIIESGYDIKECAKELQDFYSAMGNRKVKR